MTLCDLCHTPQLSQAREAGCDKLLQIENAALAERRFPCGVILAVCLCAFLEQERELFREERHAVALFVDKSSEPGRRRRLPDPVEQLRSGLSRQAGQSEGEYIGVAQAIRVDGLARCHSGKNRPRLNPFRQPGDERLCQRVGPVQILDHDQEGT